MKIESNSTAKLKRWLFDDALPFWADCGVDSDLGGFHERFSSEGLVIRDPRRARVTGRQIYAFATAEQLGWNGPARAVVRHGLAFLQRHLRDDGTFVAPLINPDDGRAYGGFDLYDQAFVLFGLAAAASVGEEATKQRDLARRLRDRMLTGWKHPLAGFEESLPRSLPLRANPHMHLLEASLAWSEIDLEGGWDALADEIVELCLARFLDPANGAVREYYDGDWCLLGYAGMDVVEPGHQFEWAWLLIRWGVDRQRPDAIGAARRLIQIAETHGVSSEHGLAVNELEPGLGLRNGMMRLWPQTERIKAFVALGTISRTPDEGIEAERTVHAATEGLLRFIDHPVRGIWWEHHCADGYIVPEPARASSLYHIVCAAAVLSNLRCPAAINRSLQSG